MKVKQCPACDKMFESYSNRGVFCSNSCKQWTQRHPGQKAPPMECRTCGAPLPSRRHKYCGTQCQPYKRPNGRATTVPLRLRARTAACAYCGKEFETSNTRKKYCTPQCGNAAYNGRLSPEELKRRVCEWCQNPIPAEKRTGARFCCVSHQVQHNQHIRRARLSDLPTQDVGLAHVLERDGWNCHLCGEPCTPETVSQDHLVPIAHPRSPGHVLANLGIAHRACNSGKRDRVRADDWKRYARNRAQEVI